MGVCDVASAVCAVMCCDVMRNTIACLREYECVRVVWRQGTTEANASYANAGGRVSRFERARAVRPAASSSTLSPRCVMWCGVVVLVVGSDVAGL